MNSYQSDAITMILFVGEREQQMNVQKQITTQKRMAHELVSDLIVTVYILSAETTTRSNRIFFF